MPPEERQLLAISVLLPVRFILLLNHRRDSLIFGSEALRIACGVWAGAEGMGGISLALMPGIAVSFHLRKGTAFCPLWATTTCVRVASFSFLQPDPLTQVSSPGFRGAVPFCSRKWGGSCGILLGESQVSW